jgi:hypothetical protein
MNAPVFTEKFLNACVKSIIARCHFFEISQSIVYVIKTEVEFLFCEQRFYPSQTFDHAGNWRWLRGALAAFSQGEKKMK